MSEEEDDYMSDAFLKLCGDTRPGLVPSHVARTYKQELKQKQFNEKNRTKTKAQLEKEKREEGLGAAISSENKGFSLLQKMGYKPGMVLGKSGTGRAEPVPLEVKLGRGGLGQESENKRKQEAKKDMLKVISVKRQKLETKHKQNFLSRMNQKMAERNVERDLNKSQKVCEQLDSQVGITEPAEIFFWPEALLPQSSTTGEDSTRNSLGELDRGYSKYVQEEEDCEEEEKAEELLDTSSPFTMDEKLEVLTMYLRNKHKYCVWCGTKYEDREDMNSHCPGDTAEAHDD